MKYATPPQPPTGYRYKDSHGNEYRPPVGQAYHVLDSRQGERCYEINRGWMTFDSAERGGNILCHANVSERSVYN